MIRNDFSNCLTATENVRVPFHDVDPAGVAWHGRYFKYFEAARCNLFESFNYGYEAMVRSGYVWPLVDATVRYVRPLTLDQRVTVIACLREWEMRLVVDYKIEDDGASLYTKAQTIQVPIDVDSHELLLGSPEVLIQNVRKRLKLLN